MREGGREGEGRREGEGEGGGEEGEEGGAGGGGGGTCKSMIVYDYTTHGTSSAYLGPSAVQRGRQSKFL